MTIKVGLEKLQLLGHTINDNKVRLETYQP